MKMLYAFVLSLFVSSAFCHEIDEDFFQQEDQHFATIAKNELSAEKTPNIFADWQEIVKYTPGARSIKLYTSSSFELGRAFSKNRIIVSQELDKFSRTYRYFILLHELGHITKNHNAALSKLFISLDVKNNKKVEASKVSKVTHALEFEADEYAIRKLYDFGFEFSGVWNLFKELSNMSPNDTVSHPAPSRRVVAMRAVSF